MALIQGVRPSTGLAIGEPVDPSTKSDVEGAVRSALVAFEVLSRSGAEDRAMMLEAIAAAIEAARDQLVEVANEETDLGTARLSGEVARSAAQLRMFAGVLRDGWYADVVISEATATRPDIRRMLVPIGPVGVFSASNFPFAFSTVGGDVASALAAGCPVVVKAHEAQPRTAVSTAAVILDALKASGAPGGTFAVVHGREAGLALVRHPGIRAVGFTGSLRGGRALFDLATSRPDPIPFYGELGSINPVVVLPAAAAARPAEIATGYLSSLTMGVGQFCTNPGVLFVPEGSPVIAEIAKGLEQASGGSMLTGGMRDAYETRTAALAAAAGELSPREALPATPGHGVRPRVFTVAVSRVLADVALYGEECFGPSSLVVTYAELDEVAAAIEALPASLTLSVHADAGDADALAPLLDGFSRTAGRLIYNEWPTGVAVCWAMHHGGPWPSTTAPAYTSVGATAITRWLRPVAYQGWPDELLPVELRRLNPLAVPRKVEPVATPAQ